MQKVFFLFLVLFLALYLVAQGTLSRPAADGIVRMRWATDDNPARKVQTALFDRMYPGKEVTVDPGLGGDQTKLIVQCATGTGPDIVDVYDIPQMQQLVNAGVLLDLTPYAKQMGFDPAHTWPAIRDGLAIDGKQYRFPCNVWANCIVYNKAIFDDHGVPYPRKDWTWDDFVAAAKRIRDTPSKSGQKHIAFANWYNMYVVDDLLVEYGGRWYTHGGLKSALDSPQAIAAARYYYDLMYKYRVIPTPAETATMTTQGGWGNSGITLFSVGKAAMMDIGRWYIVQLPNYPDLKGKVAAAPMPRVGDRPSTGVTDTRAAGVNVKSPHWRQALAFLQYLASPAYSRVIVQDGDALPPDPNVARNGAMLADAMVPDPAFHQPFVDAMQRAHPRDLSPFIDAGEVGRWFQEHIEQAENRLVTPEQAMRSLANEINQQIRVNLERQPDLQRKFRSVTGKPYTPDWWRNLQ